MKTWKRALALVLALVMALSLVALPSFAEGEEESAGDTGMPYIKDQGGKVEKDGLVMSKTIKEGENGQFLLTLEAYATGSTTTTTSTKPMDIVLGSWTSPARWMKVLSATPTRRCTKSTATTPTIIRMPTASISGRITAMARIGEESLTTGLTGIQRITRAALETARAKPAPA